MSDAPEDKSGALATFLNELNLPRIVAGRAGEALARLIGLPLEWAVAHAEKPIQSVRDRVEARTLIRRRMAQVLADKLGEDSGAVERFAASLGAEFARKQENREAVAAIAVEQLNDRSKEYREAPAGDEEASIDEDWHNRFYRYAEDASSEELREVWGRILAGEIRQPGSFSPSTLRCVSEVTREDAERFNKLGRLAVMGEFVPKLDGKISKKGDLEFTLFDLVSLEEAGLIYAANGSLTHSIRISDDGKVKHVVDNIAYVFEGVPSSKITYDIVKLTSAGQQLLNIIDVDDRHYAVRRWVDIVSGDPNLSSVVSYFYLDGGMLQYKEIIFAKGQRATS